jgi:hypothetical protein
LHLGVISVFSSQQEARNIKKGFTPGHKNVHSLREQSYQHGAEPLVEYRNIIDAKREFKKVPLDPRVPDKTVCIGAEASQEEQTKLLSFLEKNSDVFAWPTFNLLGVSRHVIEHQLQVSPSARPKKQKLQKMAEEKVKAAKAEVQRLLDAGFIREVKYPQWLANIVMVRKKNGKWRMCIDFTDLNKCCPKDNFTVVRMDQIVDTAAGIETMALLDCFLGYHQIWLHEEHEEKTSFITPFGTYCYLRMPKGLRNAGSTFYRMMKAALKDQVGRNVLSYVDDIVMVSKKRKNYIADLTETFANMHEARLKLNLEKCVFGITKGKVLGCLVSTKGIEANPNKIKAIILIRKDVHKPIGRIASLNRFISKLAERSLPFFTILRGFTNIKWDVEQQKAFDDLKSYLEHLPTLSSIEQGQPLILYVSATHSVVSRALVTEKEVMQNGKIAKQQCSMYFISEVLTGSKKFYSEMEKICYTVTMSVRKFRHYFEAHIIRIPTSQPLNDIFRNRDNFERIISKWAIELSEHVVDFEKHSAIKSQILADFVAEWTEPGFTTEGAVPESPWLVCCDGA